MNQQLEDATFLLAAKIPVDPANNSLAI